MKTQAERGMAADCLALRNIENATRNKLFSRRRLNIRIFEALTEEGGGYLVRGDLSLAGSGGGQPRIAYSRHGPRKQALSHRHLEYIPLTPDRGVA